MSIERVEALRQRLAEIRVNLEDLDSGTAAMSPTSTAHLRQPLRSPTAAADIGSPELSRKRLLREALQIVWALEKPEEAYFRVAYEGINEETSKDIHKFFRTRHVELLPSRRGTSFTGDKLDEDGEALLGRRRNPTVRRPSGRTFNFSLAVFPYLEDSRMHSRPVKLAITVVISTASLIATMGASIFLPGLASAARDLNTTVTTINTSLAAYMVAIGIFPMWWAAFSETYGRKPIYIISLCLAIVFNILAAYSNGVGMFIAMRLMSGSAAASFQTVSAGTVSDIWETRDRGMALGISSVGPLCGPLLAPIIGGALSSTWGWRSTMWFLAAFSAVCLFLILFLVPETKNKAAPNPAAAPSGGFGPTAKKILFDPLKTLLYYGRTAVALTVLYSGITYCQVFIMGVSISTTFNEPPYSYSELIVGLLYIPEGTGYILGSLVGGWWADRTMRRQAAKIGECDASGNLILRPEHRIRENAWIGAIMYPLALIWFGWTADFGVFVVAPAIGAFLFGLGSMLIFSATNAMMTEFIPEAPSAGVALVVLTRNLLSAVGTVAAAPILDALGDGWTLTMFALICLAASSIIRILQVFTPRWRAERERKMGGGRAPLVDAGTQTTNMLVDEENGGGGSSSADSFEMTPERSHWLHSTRAASRGSSRAAKRGSFMDLLDEWSEYQKSVRYSYL